jgi:hypothetical protein
VGLEIKTVRCILRCWALAVMLAIACACAAAEPPDLAGFWKKKCDEPFGLQVMHLPIGLYAVSFCGPGGCFDPGTYRPNTKIVGDPNYEVVNRLALKVRSRGGSNMYFKCTSELKPSLRYADTAGLNGVITDFGIFSRGKEKIHKEPNSTSGQIRESSGIVIERTILVPARSGIKFGYCFAIRGFPRDGPVTLTEKTSHPEIVRPDGKPSTGFSLTRKFIAANGMLESCGGYSFDHDFEVKSGNWVFSVWDDSRELISQQFVVE